jgi:uncharacterized protein (TIGR03435 family)
VDKSVRTIAKERYSFHLDWTPPDTPENSMLSSIDSLILVLRAQLGLRLQEQKNVATDQYTIEHAEKPTEN